MDQQLIPMEIRVETGLMEMDASLAHRIMASVGLGIGMGFWKRSGWLAVVLGCSTSAQTRAGNELVAASASSSARFGLAASSFLMPVAYGARWGTFGIAGYGQNYKISEHDFDASAAIAAGLGDPDRLAALEIAAVAGSISPGANSPDGFAESGSFGFKLHKTLPGFAAVAVGVNGAARWGNAASVVPTSTYLVAAKTIPFERFAAVVNLGVGNKLYTDDPGGDGIGLIGSAALYLTQWFSVIGEYTGRIATAAVSVALPPAVLPLTISVGATNLTGRFGQSTEAAISVGMGFRFQ